MEYLGFDPSTSCLLSTHASDCANTPGAQICAWNLERCLVPEPSYNPKSKRSYLNKETTGFLGVLAQVAISKRVKCKLMLDDC